MACQHLGQRAREGVIHHGRHHRMPRKNVTHLQCSCRTWEGPCLKGLIKHINSTLCSFSSWLSHQKPGGKPRSPSYVSPAVQRRVFCQILLVVIHQCVHYGNLKHHLRGAAGHWLLSVNLQTPLQGLQWPVGVARAGSLESNQRPLMPE